MIELEHLCDLQVELAEPLEMGDSPRGRRRIIPIVGGSAKGERLAGTILSGGAVINVRSFGYRHGSPEVIRAIAAGERADPSRYYMRTHMRFETGAGPYLWLNRLLAITSGGWE